jgi:Rrf2 family protein
MLVSTLAERGGIPKKFLEHILLMLKSGGVVKSKSGRGGGYELSKPPEQITIGSVIRMIEGPLAPLPCASETAFQACEDCIGRDVCGTRVVMRKVRDATAEILDHTTLADICRFTQQKAVSTL